VTDVVSNAKHTALEYTPLCGYTTSDLPGGRPPSPQGEGMGTAVTGKQMEVFL
jgi:hypothetical protein